MARLRRYNTYSTVVTWLAGLPSSLAQHDGEFLPRRLTFDSQVSPPGPLLRIHGVEAYEKRSFHRQDNATTRIRGRHLRLRDCPEWTVEAGDVAA
jgi:hypothetical protein